MQPFRLLNGGRDGGFVGDVDLHEMAADLLRQRRAQLGVQVEDRDLRPALASRSAVPPPSPDAPPVTMAATPWMSMILSLFPVR